MRYLKPIHEARVCAGYEEFVEIRSAIMSLIATPKYDSRHESGCGTYCIYSVVS